LGQELPSKANQTTFSTKIRMMVHECLVSNVPTANISSLLLKLLGHAGITVESIPQKSTIENMVHELGIISDLQVAEVVMHNSNLTLDFNATTQEGIHSVHLTTADDTYIVAVDQLPVMTILSTLTSQSFGKGLLEFLFCPL
jgi:hypothetical protein